MEKPIIKANNYISEALSLKIGEAIIIPKEDRNRLLAALYYYTNKKKSHDGWRFKTKAVPENERMVYVARIENNQKAIPSKKRKVFIR